VHAQTDTALKSRVMRGKTRGEGAGAGVLEVAAAVGHEDIGVQEGTPVVNLVLTARNGAGYQFK